jgi:hypothetical protein
MRKLNKYKIYKKIDLISRFPLRILNFKRPKWSVLKLRFKKKIRSRRYRLGKRLTDITKIKKYFKFWSRLKQSYKNSLKTYSFLSGVFDNSNNKKKLKQNSDIKLVKKMHEKIYFKNYYTPCTLIWLSHFLSSSFEARQKISSKMLLVNNKVASSTELLVKGDIIELRDKNVRIKTLLRKINKQYTICTHAEIDYYSQKLVILKDISSLSKSDYSLLIFDYINIQKLR